MDKLLCQNFSDERDHQFEQAGEQYLASRVRFVGIFVDGKIRKVFQAPICADLDLA